MSFEINLKKALEQSMVETKKKVEQKDHIADIKLLLENNEIEDLGLMVDLCPQSFEGQSHTERAKIITIEQHEAYYKGGVYTTDQLQALCVKYNLRFLESKEYKGKLDRMVPIKLKEFSEAHTPYSVKSNINAQRFYILAPEEMFTLHPKPIPSDPALFYMIDSDHYRLVHSWGKDFTIARLIQGWRTRNTFNMWIYLFAPFFLFTIGLLYAIFTNFTWSEDAKGYWISCTLLSYVMVGLVVIRFGLMNRTDIDDTTKKLWNSTRSRNYKLWNNKNS